MCVCVCEGWGLFVCEGLCACVRGLGVCACLCGCKALCMCVRVCVFVCVKIFPREHSIFDDVIE